MRSRWMRGRARRAPHRDAGGFTLLEAVVALAILGLALAPLLGSVSGGVRQQGRVEQALEAVALADARMSELSLLATDSIGEYLRPREGWFPPPFGAYRWRALLRQEPGSPALVSAAVVVEWNGGAYSLETVFHRPDLLPEYAPVQ